MSLRTKATRLIRDTARRFGVEISRFDPSHSIDLRRQKLLDGQQIELLLDVGANVGQYASLVRETGYRGEIISFEPLSAAFSALSLRAKNDARWTCVNAAVGDREGEIEIHVAANSYSSSALPMLDLHLRNAPDSKYQSEEPARLLTLDRFLGDRAKPAQRTMLKLDVQGFEKQVVLGATKTLEQVQLIESELSLAPLYEGQPLLAEMIELYRARNFKLVSIEPGFADRQTGELLQVDGIFVRG